MHNTNPRESSAEAPQAWNPPRRPRPGKGIDVPTTFWIAPTVRATESELGEPAVLPAWALRRVVREYSAPGRPVLVADTCGFNSGDPSVSFQPLPEHHDPRPERRLAEQRDGADLAVLEVETLPETVLHTVYSGREINLVLDFLRPAINAAADLLGPGGVLAVALSAPEPGHAAQRTSVVLDLARQAGLDFQQHIAVLTADLDGDRLTPRVTNAQADAVNDARRRGIPALSPAHLDLAILTHTPETARA